MCVRKKNCNITCSVIVFVSSSQSVCYSAVLSQACNRLPFGFCLSYVIHFPCLERLFLRPRRTVLSLLFLQSAFQSFFPFLSPKKSIKGASHAVLFASSDRGGRSPAFSGDKQEPQSTVGGPSDDRSFMKKRAAAAAAAAAGGGSSCP